MDKILIFGYSVFYVFQPIIGIVILCFMLFLMVYFRPQYSWQNHQFIVWSILLCLIIFSIIKSFSIILKRINEPMSIKIDGESISAIYRNGEAIQILWNDIETIRIHRDRWRAGAETIEITSNENSKRIICKKDLKKYELLKNAIIEKNKGKITDL